MTKGQKFFSIAADVTDKESIGKAVMEAEAVFGTAPDYVFACAGMLCNELLQTS